MNNSESKDPEIKAARELAALCAAIRAAHPEIEWHVRGAPTRKPKPPDRRIPEAARLFRAGFTTTQVAERIGVAAASLNRMIAEWRRAGLWPEDIKRTDGRKRKS